MARDSKKQSTMDGTAPPLADGIDFDPEVESTLYARHTDAESLKDLADKINQRGTPIPALFNQFYKFIQNPSTVSVETFKRMVDTDDTIGSGVDFLTTCMAARLGTYQHPSEEVTEWVNKRLEEIQGGWTNVVKEQCAATWAGFSVSEKVWANTEEGFVPKKIVNLPTTTLLFETDRTGEITYDGILQYQRNYNPVALAQGIGFYGGAISVFGFNVDVIRPDLFAKFGDLPFPIRTANQYNYLSIRIPKIKCIHYAFDAQGKFQNPYGRSLLRRCYKYYVMKDAFLQMLATALDRKGTPLTLVWADPNVTLVDPEKADVGTGQRTNTSRGRDVGIGAVEAAQRAFKDLHNDTVIVLPGKKDTVYGVENLTNDPNVDGFIQALDFCNKSIMRALLIPSLVFTSGDGSGSYSLGQEHSRTFDKVLDGFNSGLKQVLLQQLIKEMIAYNFPESAWKKDGLGDFSKREFSQEEKNKEMEMFERAVNMGVVDVNELTDLNKMRDMVGFEPRRKPIEQPDPFGMGGFGDAGGIEGNRNPLEPLNNPSKKGGASGGSTPPKASTSQKGSTDQPEKKKSLIARMLGR